MGFGFGPVLCVFGLAVSGCHLDCGIQLCYQPSGLFCLRHTSRASGRLPFDSLTLTLRLFWSPKGTAMCRGNSSVAPTSAAHAALIWLNTSGSIKISFGRLRWSAVTGAWSSCWSQAASFPLLAIPLLQLDASSTWNQKHTFKCTDRKQTGRWSAMQIVNNFSKMKNKDEEFYSERCMQNKGPR